MLFATGKTYRFEPPLNALALYVKGNQTLEVPNLSVSVGLCVELGQYAHKFTVSQAGQSFVFYVNRRPMPGDPVITML